MTPDVVDLGCGTGTLSVLLAGEGFAVEGLDLSMAMVAEADAPLPTASYDVVLARRVLWALPDPAQALGRWVALLRPGGRLVLVEGRRHTGAGLAPGRPGALGRRPRGRPLPGRRHPLSGRRTAR